MEWDGFMTIGRARFGDRITNSAPEANGTIGESFLYGPVTASEGFHARGSTC